MESKTPTRRYDSPRRKEQAAATRRAILRAGQALFERQGYAATSMAAIAKQAGVASKTVYLGFESKSGLLRALWNDLLRGDEEGPAVGRQPWYTEVLDEKDPERQLRLNARNSRAVKVRAGGIMEVIRGAAPGDLEIAALWSRIQTEFYENQRAIVDSLGRKRALRKGLGVARAADILWTLNHPTLYGLLVNERGWSARAYEQWLGDAFCSQLLR